MENNQAVSNSTPDLTAISPILEKYKGIKGSLINVLQETQDIFGYIPADAVYVISEALCISPAKILGVATFYAQFRLTPVGKNMIMLCKGTACHVNGADRIDKAICEELGITDGETTADGLFSLKTVACLGCCSLSPVMMINGDTYGSLTPQSAVAILRNIRKEDESK